MWLAIQCVNSPHGREILTVAMGSTSLAQMPQRTGIQSAWVLCYPPPALLLLLLYRRCDSLCIYPRPRTVSVLVGAVHIGRRHVLAEDFIIQVLAAVPHFASFLSSRLDKEQTNRSLVRERACPPPRSCALRLFPIFALISLNIEIQQL